MEEKPVNRSLSGVYLEVKRLLNRTEAFACKRSFVVANLINVAERRGELTPFSKNIYFTKESYYDFMNQYMEGNKKLATEYLGRPDGVLFKDEIIFEEENTEYESEKLLKLRTFVEENDLAEEVLSYAETLNRKKYNVQYSKEVCVDVLAEVLLLQKDKIDKLTQNLENQKQLVAELKSPVGYVKHALKAITRKLIG